VTKYILHGGFTRVDNESNRAFFEEIVRDVPDGGTILLCYFASKADDYSDRFKKESQNLTEQSHCKNLIFLLANEEDFVEQVKQASAIFIRGGSTPKLLEILKKYPEFKENLDGKTVAGSSAGAYAIGRYSPFHDDESGGEVREGLGLLPLRVVCHFESPDLPPNPRALSSLKNLAQDLELLLLRDFEWRVYKV
jgi:peptidase E